MQNKADGQVMQENYDFIFCGNFKGIYGRMLNILFAVIGDLRSIHSPTIKGF